MEHTPTLCHKGKNIPISFCHSLASSSDLKRQPSELCEHPHFCPAEFEARQTCLFGRSGSHCCRRHIGFFTRDSRVAFSKLMQRPVKNGERASGRVDAYRISRATELGARAASAFSGISGISLLCNSASSAESDPLNRERERDIFWADIFLILNHMDYTFLSRYLAPVNDSVSALKYPRLLASSSLCHVTSLKVKMAVAAAVAPLVYLPMPTDELWGTKESMEGRISLSTALLASARIWPDRLRQQWGRRARAQDVIKRG